MTERMKGSAGRDKGEGKERGGGSRMGGCCSGLVMALPMASLRIA